MNFFSSFIPGRSAQQEPGQEDHNVQDSSDSQSNLDKSVSDVPNDPVPRRGASEKQANANLNSLDASMQQILEESLNKGRGDGADMASFQMEQKYFQKLIDQGGEIKKDFIAAAREYARIKILDRPTRRLQAMIELREELLDLSEEFQLKQKEVLERFKEQEFVENLEEGLLRQSFSEYKVCFTIDIEKVESLLESEVQEYNVELKQAEFDAQNLVKKMQDFMDENETLLRRFLETSEGRVQVLSKGALQRNQQQNALQEIGMYDASLGNYLEGQANIEQVQVQVVNQQRVEQQSRASSNAASNQRQKFAQQHHLVPTTDFNNQVRV